MTLAVGLPHTAFIMVEVCSLQHLHLSWIMQMENNTIFVSRYTYYNYYISWLIYVEILLYHRDKVNLKDSISTKTNT